MYVLTYHDLVHSWALICLHVVILFILHLQFVIEFAMSIFILIYGLRSIVLLFSLGHESVVFGYFCCIFFLFSFELWWLGLMLSSFNHIMLCIVIFCIYWGNFIKFLYLRPLVVCLSLFYNSCKIQGNHDYCLISTSKRMAISNY